MPTIDVTHSPDGVLLVTLNRPEARNALRRADFIALIDTFTDAASDASVRALVLASDGPTFCAGGDLKETGDIGSVDLDDHPVHQFADLLAAFGKPLVGAVHGPAVGFGFTMLLHFDLVVAGPVATFAAPFARLGVPTEAGSSYLLPTVAGAAVAARMLLLGEKLDAREALECGLVSHLVEGDRDAVLAAALHLAERLAGFRPDAVQVNKRLLRESRQAMVTAAQAREPSALTLQLAALRASAE